MSDIKVTFHEAGVQKVLKGEETLNLLYNKYGPVLQRKIKGSTVYKYTDDPKRNKIKVMITGEPGESKRSLLFKEKKNIRNMLAALQSIGPVNQREIAYYNQQMQSVAHIKKRKSRKKVQSA